jgi:hypothetical protein
MSRIAMLAILVAAAVPATAQAGGWATVELDGGPAGLSAGEPWRVELTVLQHGITPLDGVTPSIRIRNDAGVTRMFPARPAGRPGRYVAVVRYPEAGIWRTRIFDGFTDAYPHKLKPVAIAPAGAGRTAAAESATDDTAPAGSVAAPDDGPPWPQMIAIGCVMLLFAGGFAAATFRGRGTRDRRRPASRPVAG